MSWESDSPAKERDRTKLLWAGVAGLFALMLGALWLATGSGAHHSRVRAKHVLVSFDPSDPADRARALETINGLRQDILDGQSFSKIAREYSSDENSRKRGGDLGWVERNSLADAMEEYVWGAPLNQLSDVILTGFGFHLVIVTGRQVSDADRYEQELRRRTFGGDAGPGEEAKGGDE